ncbi:MAG: FAD-dependent oxidoreductase [Aeriscardovia sp.]|nr:FAD-dependent oxidoreductase [Aeriscardovia sp.]
MQDQYKSLFTPWKIRDVEIKNRIVMLPMEGTNWIKWEAATEWSKGIEAFFEERSAADVGLFICGAIPQISLVTSKWLYKHPEVFKNVKPLMDKVHANGSKVFFQLTAGPGRSTPLVPMMGPIFKHKLLENAVQPVFPSKWWYVAPDADLKSVWKTDVTMHQFTTEQISKMVYALGQTAKLCKDNGVDGVEIHAVHEGYLLDQFAMKYTNHRTDAYGGSLENRLRFACEVVREIKKVCGEDYPVSVRYSVTSKVKGFNQGAVPGEEYTEIGRDFEESKRAIKILEDAGYDMFNCDNGTYDSWYWAHPPVYAPLNTNLSDVEAIKPYTTKPVIAGGRMQAETAARSITEGKIDAMGVGRQILCDGQYVKKIEEDRMDEIRPCISCHAACLPLGNMNGKGTDFDMTNIEMGRCALNPYTFRENEYKTVPAKKPKKISVIGGGIGGMEFALQAAARGHKVDLYEKSDRLGGVFNAAAAPSFKEKDRDLLAWYKNEIGRSNVAVHMNSEINDPAKLDADEIVVAIGATARKLGIPGADRAVTALSYLYGEQEVGDNVVVIGGGLTGSEIAYDLALKGKHPVVVEMLDCIVGAKGICSANSTMLRDLLAFHKVPVYVNATTREITDDSVVISTPDGDKTIRADSVIMSVGYISDTKFTPDPKDKKSNIHCIGDCDKVGNLKTVIKQAYDLAQEISYK